MAQGMGDKDGVGMVGLNLATREAAGLGATAPSTGRSRKQAATALCGARWRHFQ